MGFMVSRGVQSAVRNPLCVIRKSEYPDSRLRLSVFACFRLCPPVMTDPPAITGWLRMHGAAHREPPHKKCVARYFRFYKRCESYT